MIQLYIYRFHTHIGFFLEGGTSLVAQLVKNPSATRETWVRSLGWEDPLEKVYPPHCSGLENPVDRIVQGSQRVGPNWVTFTFLKKIFFLLWFIIACWIEFSVLYSRTLFSVYSIYNSLQPLMPTSQASPPPLATTGLLVCSPCTWIHFCFINRFIYGRF